jgi:hypothetical protein
MFIFYARGLIQRKVFYSQFSRPVCFTHYPPNYLKLLNNFIFRSMFTVTSQLAAMSGFRLCLNRSEVDIVLVETLSRVLRV